AKTFPVAAGSYAPGGPNPGQAAIAIQGGADFLWREIAFDIGDADPGTIFARFRDGQGKKLSADLLSVEELSGPIAISQLLPKSLQCLVDLQNTGADDIDVQVILKGVNLYQPLGINNCMLGFEPEEYVPLYETY